MEMIRRPVLLIHPDVKVTRWRSRCWHLALERVTSYTGVLAGVSTAVFCSRGDLADRPEEKIEGSGSEVYWLCGSIKFYVRHQTAFFKSVCIVRCVVYWFPFVLRTSEVRIPNVGSDQLSDILHGFIRYLLWMLVYSNRSRRRLCTKLHDSMLIIDCAAVMSCCCCYYYCCYHHHHHQQQQKQ